MLDQTLLNIPESTDSDGAITVAYLTQTLQNRILSSHPLTEAPKPYG